MYFLDELQAFSPACEQEVKDKELILEWIAKYPDTILTRSNRAAHLTASSMIFNSKRDQVLMVYHNIYHSWSWTGGHADGENDLLKVALKEAKEETGVRTLFPLSGLVSLDILPVWGHWKRGSYVNSHLHLNFSYLLGADESEILTVKEDENSGVMWIPVDKLSEFVTEPTMLPIYEKLIRGGKR